MFPPWLAKSCTRAEFLAIRCLPCPGSGSPDPSSNLSPIQISIWTRPHRVHRPAGLTLVTEKAPQFSEDQPHHEPRVGQAPWAALGGRCRGARGGTEGKPTRSRGASLRSPAKLWSSAKPGTAADSFVRSALSPAPTRSRSVCAHLPCTAWAGREPRPRPASPPTPGTTHRRKVGT